MPSQRVVRQVSPSPLEEASRSLAGIITTSFSSTRFLSCASLNFTFFHLNVFLSAYFYFIDGPRGLFLVKQNTWNIDVHGQLHNGHFFNCTSLILIIVNQPICF